MVASTVPWGKALGFAVVIWMAGFVWGSMVFMTPALKGVPSVPYVTQYPVISFPLLVAFAVMAFYFARSCLREAAGKAAAGAKVGAIFAGVNFLLDLLVIVVAFKGGPRFYAWASIWVAYAVLFAVPWLLGRLWESWYST